jgi:2-oxoglutarate ferredoxin oxidoreductase subunit beta
MPVYVDYCTLHTTHGRALAFATGLKLARPKMRVLTVMGDGDALAIGGNHFIHTARRNMNITAIVINNMIYGMTGGQYSPATPTGGIATTAVYGNIDQPFDISALAQVAGASFVARSTVAHVVEMQKLIAQALEHPGFSVVEILSNCHTYYGKMNRISTPVQFHRWFQDNTAPATLPPEKREGKITRGVLVDRVMPGYLENYVEMMERAGKEKN